jgi:ribulose-5-phosphate 4-epimerase/fuculose-1-phosphate aldolase
LTGDVPIHPYAPTVGPGSEEECAAMCETFGTARTMLMENHGVVTVGGSIAEAMMRLWYVTKAAEIQVAALSTRDGVAAVNQVTNPQHMAMLSKGGDGFLRGVVADAEFAHHKRVIDRVNPGYDDL